jgi:hypothetical protein
MDKAEGETYKTVNGELEVSASTLTFSPGITDLRINLVVSPTL